MMLKHFYLGVAIALLVIAPLDARLVLEADQTRQKQKNQSKLPDTVNLDKKIELRKGNLLFFDYGFNIVANSENTVEDGISTKETIDESKIAPAVEGKALAYPNPFSLRESGQIGYRLSKNLDIEFRMYNMLGYLVAKNSFTKGTPGGKSGYNKITISLNQFNGKSISAGVYFFLIMHKGDILAKGKLAIKP